jgi:hypothetical protein
MRRTLNKKKQDGEMKKYRFRGFAGAVASLLFFICLLPAAGSRSQEKNGAPMPQRRDGQHDFDFDIGTWKTHLRRLVHTLTGSTTWVEYEGTTVVRKVWNGRANLAELEAVLFADTSTPVVAFKITIVAALAGKTRVFRESPKSTWRFVLFARSTGSGPLYSANRFSRHFRIALACFG